MSTKEKDHVVASLALELFWSHDLMSELIDLGYSGYTPRQLAEHILKLPKKRSREELAERRNNKKRTKK